jgi:hypothetical protein
MTTVLREPQVLRGPQDERFQIPFVVRREPVLSSAEGNHSMSKMGFQHLQKAGDSNVERSRSQARSAKRRSVLAAYAGRNG